jgi:hypothetical protein
LLAAVKSHPGCEVSAIPDSHFLITFPAPETGKIAVKMINHYGDDVMKVYDVQGAVWSAESPRLSAKVRVPTQGDRKIPWPTSPPGRRLRTALLNQI